VFVIGQDSYIKVSLSFRFHKMSTTTTADTTATDISLYGIVPSSTFLKKEWDIECGQGREESIAVSSKPEEESIFRAVKVIFILFNFKLSIFSRCTRVTRCISLRSRYIISSGT
jgi:hypothetical protein